MKKSSTKRCPSADKIRRWVENRLSTREDVTVTAHLTSCTICKAAAEQTLIAEFSSVPKISAAKWRRIKKQLDLNFYEHLEKFKPRQKGKKSR